MVQEKKKLQLSEHHGSYLKSDGIMETTLVRNKQVGLRCDLAPVSHVTLCESPVLSLSFPLLSNGALLPAVDS